MYGEEGLADWRKTGKRAFEVSKNLEEQLVRLFSLIYQLATFSNIKQVKGKNVDIPYSFLADAQSYPPYPQYGCPTLVVHGLQDDVVPVATTLRAALEKSEEVKDITTVILVDDDHALARKDTLKLMTSSLTEFLDLRSNSEGT